MKTINLITKLSIIFGCLLITGSVFYYFVVFSPKREMAKIELQKQESAEAQARLDSNISSLDDCLKSVDKRLIGDGLKGVSNEGIKIVLDLVQKQKDDCFKQFPVK